MNHIVTATLRCVHNSLELFSFFMLTMVITGFKTAISAVTAILI